jgi:hypothetical protein
VELPHHHALGSGTGGPPAGIFGMPRVTKIQVEADAPWHLSPARPRPCAKAAPAHKTAIMAAKVSSSQTAIIGFRATRAPSTVSARCAAAVFSTYHPRLTCLPTRHAAASGAPEADRSDGQLESQAHPSAVDQRRRRAAHAYGTRRRSTRTLVPLARAALTAERLGRRIPASHFRGESDPAATQD